MQVRYAPRPRRQTCSQARIDSNIFTCKEPDAKNVMRLDLRVRNASAPGGNATFPKTRLLSYYRLVTGKEFALFFDDPAWEGRVLQVAHTEPTIHHASLAISALSLDNNSAGRFWGSRQACSAVEYSTKQYNLAIQRLNDCMERSIPQATEIMILGILMFIHLEFMRGYRDVVSVHLQGAFALLRKLKTSQFDTNYFQTALVYIEAQQQELWHFDGLRPG
ncbi:hypothetical protein SCAR479_00605 [Seiridium cardinale]|uniref:Uncharacterized protein n=1 Tax=Seiridium cardinale TaxID=138064 RepID=A0ABR2Y9Z9_9PEZI